MPDILAVKGLRAGYGDTIVLEDIDMAMAERSTLAVLGRNGVGKTTLLATLMGQTTRHAGEILWQGRNIEKLPVYERSRAGIGFVPQAREIFPSLSVEENLLVAERHGRWTLERVYDLFPRMAERKSHMGNQISGGEQQMLSIGRALMTNPDLLILDEATEGLAPLIAKEIWSIIKTIRASGIATVIVDKNYAAVMALSNRSVVLVKGRVVFAGESAELSGNQELMHRFLGV